MSEISLDRARQMAAEIPGCILLETSRVERPASHSETGRTLLFAEPVEWIEALRLPELPALFARLEQARGEGLWAAGYVSYECGYHWEPTAAAANGFAQGWAQDWAQGREGLPLAAFGLYRAPLNVARGGGGGDRRGVDGFAMSASPGRFAGKVEQIRRWIEAGDTYQANLTDRVAAELPGKAAALFAHMMVAQPVEFGALLRVGERVILSASPELFFHCQGRRITVRPMKGTARRGADAAEDDERARELAADAKNRAENLMIVDLLRSDLGRVAEMGSVQVERLFAVERFPTLLQMVSEIEATLREDVDLYGIFAALFPSGSIVGAPKVRTMQILRELEGRERGVYTGAIGFVAPDGEAVFSVAIRTAVLAGRQLTMGVGAGITYDSAAEDEYAECLLKAEFLRDRKAPTGLIETMRWEGSGCALLEGHMERLGRSAQALGFVCSEARVRAAIAAEAGRLPGKGAWRMRMVMDRAGAVVFSPPEQIEKDTGELRAMLWREPVCSGDLLLRHKTTKRAVYDTALAEARAQGYVDALFVNEQGMVTEGAIHSLLVRHGERWRTPPLLAGVLPGVYRAKLLGERPELREEDVPCEELWTADEIRLCNAVRGERVLSGLEDGTRRWVLQHDKERAGSRGSAC